MTSSSSTYSSEFLYGFNSTVAIVAVLACYIWVYYMNKYTHHPPPPTQKINLDDSQELITINTLDDDTLDAAVQQLEMLILDMYDEQERRGHKTQTASE